MIDRLIKIYLLGFIFFSCNPKNQSLELLNHKGKLQFQLDSLTPNSGNHFQVYTKNDSSFLFILTPFNNRFVYYDLTTRQKLGDFTIDDDFGNLKIGFAPPSGFYIHNLDSIFLYDYRKHNLYRSDIKGNSIKEYDFMENYPEDRSYWGGFFQESKPYFINDSLLSIGGAVQWGSEAIEEDQKVDVVLNLKTKEVYRETPLPLSFKVGNFYSTVRLRPSRAFNDKDDLVYYSYYNSDSIFLRNLKNDSWLHVNAPIVGMASFKEIDNLSDFRESERGPENQMAYNISQGGHFSIFYDDINDKVVRVSFLGKSDFDIQSHKKNPYQFELILSFFDPKTLELFGQYRVDQFDYRFMMFSKGSFYVLNSSYNISEDLLTFLRYEYPKF
jgi:hypothetical protein